MSERQSKALESTQEDRKALGERLRIAREYLGFSQEEVATFLRVPRSALSLVETGQRKVDALELKKLASLYKRPTDYFTGESVAELTLGAGASHLARKVASLSADDQEELSRFVDFLHARKSAGD
jgi:transcriptional regulator with XRE-family HTH domain